MTPLPVAVLAHGLGDPADTGLPVPLLLGVAAAAVLVPALMPHPGQDAPADGTMPAARPRGTGTAVTLVRWLTATGALGLGAVAALGAPGVADNPAPRLLFDLFWPALVLTSAVVGPVWPVANPLRLLSRLLARVAGDPGEQGVAPPPAWARSWSGPVGVAVFIWCWSATPVPHRGLPTLVLLAVLAVWGLAGATVYGQAWYRHADPFEVVSRLLGRMTPVPRRRGAAQPLTGAAHGLSGAARTLAGAAESLAGAAQRLAATRASPALVSLCALLVGADVFDAVRGLRPWQLVAGAAEGWAATPAATAGLVVCTGVVLLTFRLGSAGGVLAPAFIPVVAGWAFAHAFPVILLDAQVVLRQLSDPLSVGADLFGTGSRAVDETIIWPALGASVQLVVFLGAHSLAVRTGDRMARRIWPPPRAAAAQVPLRAVLALSAVGGVALRLAAG